jgi:hypothetical protein
MMHMGALFRSRAWSLLEPDYSHECILSGFGDFGGSDYAGAARTSDGNTIIVYLPTKRTVTVDLTKISGVQAKAWWFQPGTGIANLIGTFPATGEMQFTPDTSGDWVLVIDNADADLPPPGSSNEPVPVELLGFFASVSEARITLHWTTASESGNYGFDIHRSVQGRDFERIGFSPGKGTVSTPTIYAYVDSNVTKGTYFYRLTQTDLDGHTRVVSSLTVDVAGPREFQLHQNYPNPFNPRTTLSYALTESAFVSLKVFGVSGAEITTLVEKTQSAGYYSINFDAMNLSSGIYFYQLRIDGRVLTKKMLLFK